MLSPALAKLLATNFFLLQLPWSTANEDLVELFETTGQVELAEILFDGTRSKGCGVVQFAQVAEAETAIAKFQQYMYGGRPLGECLMHYIASASTNIILL